MYTFSSRSHVVHKVQNKSWLHVDMTRKADKCTKIEYARAKRAISSPMCWPFFHSHTLTSSKVFLDYL